MQPLGEELPVSLWMDRKLAFSDILQDVYKISLAFKMEFGFMRVILRNFVRSGQKEEGRPTDTGINSADFVFLVRTRPRFSKDMVKQRPLLLLHCR